VQNEPEEKVKYWQKVVQFHSTPSIKMLYHFVSYIIMKSFSSSIVVLANLYIFLTGIQLHDDV
jgi:hypothetical protein